MSKTPVSNSLTSNTKKIIHKPNNSDFEKKSAMNAMNSQNCYEVQKEDSSTGSEGSDSIAPDTVNKNEEITIISTETPEEEKNVLLWVMNAMNAMNAMPLHTFIANIAHSTNFTNSFGGGALESVLEYFLLNNNNPVPYEVVAESVGKSTDSIRSPITRHGELFAEGEKDGMKKTIHLSEYGQQYCRDLIENYVKVQNNIKEKLSGKSKNKQSIDELTEKIRVIMSSIKPEIEGKIAIVDFMKLAEWDNELSEELLERPDEIMPLMVGEFGVGSVEEVRIKNLPQSESMPVERVRAKHVDKLVRIDGRCVSLSNVRPLVTNVKYECPACGTIISVKQIEKKIKEPSRCSCGRRSSFKELSQELVDEARVIIEDLQEKTDNANTQRIDGYIQNGLTLPEHIAVFTPGEELTVTGIVRRVVKKTSHGTESKLGLQIEIIDAEKIEEEVNVDTFTDEEIHQFRELSVKINQDGMKALTPSFAPDVHGYEPQKNAIILQCCTRRNEPKASSTRNKISMLMIGDPGIAKTVLGKFAVSITPHSKMAAGGGSSAVGITASVVKEDESMGGYRVEPGAMVLAKELLFLDEMNNITEDDKPKLQQGMSEQQISINKANLHVNLKVQGGMLATANPIKGHFVDGESFVKQFNISSPILNRFDAIFVMEDIISEERDHAIAEIMIKRRRNEIKPEYEKEFLRKFFVYVRSRPEPEINKEIMNKVKKIYSSSRKAKVLDVIINPRFIESLTRFMEASAKLRLSGEVENKDIERALEILKHSHFQTKEYKYFEAVEGVKAQ